MVWQIILATLLLLHACVPPVMGYGEPDANGHPNYQERANHVFLNAVRISPSQYKTVYMAGYSPSPSSILGSSYPARPPVYLEPKLINSAYYHSNDMATNGCFQHNSCDGTATFTRIGQYYTCSGSQGENIAAGYSDPLATSNQWLCDQVGSACAADGSGSDGHRSNMMSGTYKAVGTGYAYNSASTYKHYWTQDFGGASCAPVPTSPIYGGSHRVASGSTRFIAVYYTSPAVAPSTATVTIGGTAYPLALDVGAAGAGTYFYSQTSGTACRSYFFTIGSYRYPETGCLVTYGEGSCTTSFDATCGGTTSAATTASSTTATTASATTSTTKAPTTTATTASATTSTTKAPTTTTAAATTSTTKAPTTTTAAATTSTTKAPTTTTAATTSVATTSTTKAATTTTTGGSTTGSSGVYYLYSSSLQNSWVLQYNSGVTVTNSFAYSSVTGLKAVLTTSGSANFVMFNHAPTVANIWTTLQFNVAASGSGTIWIFFNGGYYQAKTVTTAWQTISIPLSSLANPSTGAAYTQLGSPNQLVFRNAGSSGITLYLSNVALV